MVTRTACVRNGYGIHCRPAALIAQEALGYTGSAILVKDNDQEADIASILALVALGLQAGTSVQISVSGPDEDSFCERLVELFETEFDFSR